MNPRSNHSHNGKTNKFSRQLRGQKLLESTISAYLLFLEHPYSYRFQQFDGKNREILNRKTIYNKITIFATENITHILLS